MLVPPSLGCDAALLAVLQRQAGVVSRAQLREAGLADHDVRRLRRRRELVALGHGVFLSHTGEPTWLQTAWSAVLGLWPAALWYESALRAAGGSRPVGAPIHVAVDASRTPAARPGVRVHRVKDLEGATLWSASPPRQRVEHAVLDVAGAAKDDLGAVAVVADAVQARLTTAPRLRAAAATRNRLARRELIDGVLTSVADGVNSALEHGYLVRVERPHGLPRGRRQARRGDRWDDVSYDAQGVLVELDGRLFHDGAAAFDRDHQRDLEASAASALHSLRLGWGQVYARPCVTAQLVAAVLTRRGWTGRPVRCPSCPDVRTRVL